MAMESIQRLASSLPAISHGPKVLHSKLQYMYFTQQLPDTFVGDVELVEVTGRGWCVMATGVIEAGAPIIICPPLALLSGPPGHPAPPEDLQALVQNARWLAPSRQLLEAMSDGQPRAGEAAAAAALKSRQEATQRRRRQGREHLSFVQQQQEREIFELMRQLGMSSSSGLMIGEEEEGGEEDSDDIGRYDDEDDALRGVSRGAREGGKGTAGPPSILNLAEGLSDERREGQLGSRLALRIDPQRLSCILQANAFSDVWQDLPSSTTRGEAPASVSGLWPLFSLLNHSCAPNAAHAVIGGTRPLGETAPDGVGGGSGGGWDAIARPGLGPRMVVRATRRIAPGEEVVVNYIGRGALAPAEQRRADLESGWGFECRCQRCMAELSLNPLISERIHAAAQRAAELAPEVACAAVAGDREALEAAAGEASRLLRRLYDACERVGLPPFQVRSALGACYEAQHVVAAARMAMEPEATKSLAALAEEATLAGSLLPGSDLHTLTAARLVGALRDKHGSKDRRTQAAAAEALETHKLRYGPMELRVARPLLEASIAWAERLSAGDGNVTAAAAEEIAGKVYGPRGGGGQEPAAAAAAAAPPAAQGVAAAAQGAPQQKKRRGRRKQDEKDQEQQRQQVQLQVGDADRLIEVSSTLPPADAPSRAKRRGRPRKTDQAEGGSASKPLQPPLPPQQQQQEASPARLEEELSSRQQWQDPDPLAPRRRRRRGKAAGMQQRPRQQEEEGDDDEDDDDDDIARALAAKAYAVEEISQEELHEQARQAQEAAERLRLEEERAPRVGAGGGGIGEKAAAVAAKRPVLSGASLPLLSRWMAGGTSAGSAAVGDGLTPDSLNVTQRADDSAGGQMPVDETRMQPHSSGSGVAGGEGGVTAEGVPLPVAAPSGKSGGGPSRDTPPQPATAPGIHRQQQNQQKQQQQHQMSTGPIQSFKGLEARRARRKQRSGAE